MPMSFPYTGLRLFTFLLLLLQSLQNTKNITFAFITLFLPLPLLSYYFATKYFAVDIELSRCGWIDNSTANTWEYSLAPLVSNQ